MEWIKSQQFTIVFCIVLLNLSTFVTSGNLGPSDQSEAYFNGSSYIRLHTTISFKKQTGLSFRTCHGGLLFSQQQNGESIELSVNPDGVRFVVKTNSKQYDEKVFGKFLDNKWHTVYLQYILGNLTMNVDGQTKLLANSSYQDALISASNLFNEGAAVLLIGKNFNGCILEGPSIVFNSTIIMSTHNILFGPCPIPYNSCLVRENLLQVDYCITEPCMRHGTCINGQTTYTCTCLPRYTGKNCEIDQGDPCQKKPSICKNAAKCTSDQTGEYKCICPIGYTGTHCEIKITTHPLCNNNPCMNGGTCDVAVDGNVICQCQPGYTGPRCEQNIDECSQGPCLNDGICIDGYNNFTCDCSHTGYKGYLCDVNINECLMNPCLNHGTCFDTYGSYMCQCLPGFGGQNCENNVKECLSQPCLNRGVCVDHTGGYTCRCLPGFTGEHCEFEQHQCDPDICADCLMVGNTMECACKKEYPGEFPNCNMNNLCANNPCKNGGECNVVNGIVNCSCPPGVAGTLCDIRLTCKDKPCLHAISCQDFLGGYYCTCEKGWTGVNCNMVLGPCSSQPCLNTGTCFRTGRTFSCICPSGFSGRFCQKNVDDCASKPCLNGGTCIDIINGYICNCTDQYMGIHCELEYDVCLAMKPCYNNGTCHTNPNNKYEYQCKCLKGFLGDHCEINKDDCIDNKCPSTMICVDLVNNYACRCPPGLTGDNCSLDLDPCAKNPCINGATCHVDVNTHAFTCTCPPGYTGQMCNEDIDECLHLSNSYCNNGICVNNEGSFQCYCQPGYTGERCNLDFDECLSMPCKNNATCINKVNNYECRCPLGYSGKDCSTNINECDPMPCAQGATCIDGVNEFKCLCQPGLTGQLCDINIDDCESNPCKNDAQCIDGLNSYTCNCNETGYEGELCDINIDDCKGNPCRNGAQCQDLVKDYECNCFNGYTGKNCEIDVNECESNPCKYSGTCLEKSNMTLYSASAVAKLNITLPETYNRPFDYADAEGYECLCVPGVTGHNCEININECESSPCFQGSCVDQIGGYICECDEGFEGQHCDIDIDECAKYKPCIHGTCMDRKANYYCDCDPNYGGKNCSVELMGCMDSPCMNHGQCVPYLVNETEHKFNCSCPNGYHGNTCERITTMSLNGNSLITVNTTREEGYDVQFRFKTTLGDGLLALGKGLTYYILELSRGRLNLHSSLLNKWEGVFIGSNLNDSQWQKVFVAINSTHLVLSANDEQTIYPITFNENYNVSSTSFPLTYIGGIPSNLRKLTHGQPFLVGCTEDVLINGEWVLPEVHNSSWVQFQNVDVGCLREPQCNPNPCHSGGHCTDRWRDFSCTCERPYLGHTCQYNYTAATFGYENITDSLVTVNVYDYARRAIRSIVDISMFIRTRQSRGQIFYLGSIDETYIAAQLENGELLVRIQFNSPMEYYTVGGVKLDNGYNHLIEVVRNVTLVQVKLNGTEYFRKTISATGALDAQVLYLGGQPQSRAVRQATETVVSKMEMPPTAAASPLLSNINFKGIIQDVQISNGSTVMVVEFFPLEAQDLEIPLQFGDVTFDKMTVLEGVHSDDSCINDPCHHGSTCENTWNDYRCLCPRGFKGKNCTELEFCELEECPLGSECRNLDDSYECVANSTFTGKTPPLLYKFSASSSLNDTHFNTIEITYRTRSWGTILFAFYQHNYFTIFIYHNDVIVEWNFNDLIQTKRFRKDHFQAQWITLYFIYNDNVFRGGFKENVIDEAPELEVNNFDFDVLNDILQNGTIYIAGSDEKSFNYRKIIENADNFTSYFGETTTTSNIITNSVDSNEFDNELSYFKIDKDKQTDRFKGCLSEIRIGGLILPFFTTKTLYPRDIHSNVLFELLPEASVQIGCTLCYNEDCYNQGFCINPSETYKCNCTEGFTADDCSINIDECENNQCQNNATCVDLIGTYNCTCLPGFDGEHCETDINECLSNPCKHGGTCIDQIGTFKCECPDDFVGKQCEAPLLITCDNKPCKEGATCKTGANEVTGNNFTCICPEGMEGVYCDTPFCLLKHCEQGHCNTTGDVPYCQCQRGFEGQFCEINIDDCVSPIGESPCQNGGVCIDGIWRYDCDCQGTGYTGVLCEVDIDECNQTVNTNPCGQNGICENMPGTYRCTCKIEGKCGYHCALDDLCVTETPCEHGVCLSSCTDISDYICTCEEGWTGKNCTDLKIAATKSDPGINILYIILPIVLAILIGLAIGLAVLVNVARSKRATRGTYSPSAQEFCNPRVELNHVLKPPPEERLI